MADERAPQAPSGGQTDNAPELFAPPPPPDPSSRKTVAVTIAAVLIVIVGVALLLSRPHGGGAKTGNANEPTPLAAYAVDLPLSNGHMSTASVPAGGDLYYIEGTVRNTGTKTVTGATVELIFRDSLGKIAQRDTEPLKVVIATEPAVDTTDLAHAPLAPGISRDFQITIEHVSAEWNGQYPELRVIGVETQ